MLSFSRHPFLLIAFSVSLLILTGCSDKKGKVLLEIPDRDWETDRPDPHVGWCGETCIQEAMAYFGKEVTQQVIYLAGHNPGRPDLDYAEIDTALRVLSVQYTAWDDGNHDFDSFLIWLRNQIQSNHPVICGVKAYPGIDHSWIPDHYVLAVGFDRSGFFINTNTDGRKRISIRQLKSYHYGFSFKNDQQRYFARAITGL
jgi:hypothetical protein